MMGRISARTLSKILDDDKCPYFDQDDGTCIIKWDNEVSEKTVVLLCIDKFIDCIHYENERKNQRYTHVFCLKCMYDVEDSYGWSAAKYWNYCPQCGFKLVFRPSPYYNIKKMVQRLKSFLPDKNGDTHEQ